MTIRSLGSGPRALPEGSGDVVHQLRERPRQGRGTGNEAEADTLGREKIPLASIRLAQPTSGSVPYHAPPEPTSRGESDRAWTWLPHPQQHERRALHASPPPEQPIELRPGPQPLFAREHRARRRRSGHRLTREPAPPLGAPTLQHFSAAFGRHSLAKPVRLRPPTTIRLKRPLHDFLLVGAMRTAAHPTDGPLTASSGAPRRGSRPPPLLPERALCYGGPPGRVLSACVAVAPYTSPHHDPCERPSVAGNDGRSPGVIHRRG
jgi:hypothetical protein